MFSATRTRIAALQTVARPRTKSTITDRVLFNHKIHAPSCRSYISQSTPRRMATVSEQPPTRAPRPIPLDIPGSAGAEAAHSTQGIQSQSSSSSSGRYSAFERFGGPVIKVLVYATAATLTLHLIYNHLALEEYRISSNQKIRELEEEIVELKRQPVQHPTGGRGEFI